MMEKPATPKRDTLSPRYLTNAECRKVAGSGYDYSIFGRATPEQLTDAIFAIAGKRS